MAGRFTHSQTFDDVGLPIGKTLHWLDKRHISREWPGAAALVIGGV
jgi:hypothetical protein